MSKFLKEKYVSYFSDVPVQKYAAMFIGRDEDTIIRWKKEDAEFADSIQRAKAEWVRKKVLASKAEFALERLEKDVFGKQELPQVQLSQYGRYVQSSVSINPNTARNREISQAVTNLMMEMTKRPIAISP